MKRETITLAFECDEQWENMKGSSSCRLCLVCNKQVYDLTNKSAHEIARITKEKGDICGMFLTEQLEKDLMPVELPFFSPLKYYAAVVATFLGIEAAQAGAKTVKENPVEIFAGSGEIVTSDLASIDDPTGRDSRKKRPKKLVKKSNKSNKDEPVKVKKKKKVYFSKRFPFIHIKKRRRTGKYRVIGTPTF